MPISEEEARLFLGGSSDTGLAVEDVDTRPLEGVSVTTDEGAPTPPRSYTVGEAREMFGGTGVTGGLQPGAGAALDSGGLPATMQGRIGIASGALAKQREALEKRRDLSRPGIPLDRVSGVQDMALRARLNALPDPLSKLQFLGGQLRKQGINTVEHPPRFEGGSFILPQVDEKTGEIKDVVIDEPGFSVADLADLANEAIPLVMGLAGERRAAAKGVTSTFKRLLAGGAGISTGRFAQTTAARATGGVAQDVEADVKSALVEAGADVVGGLGMARLVNLGNAVAFPNRAITRSPAYQEYVDAVNRIEEATGVPIKVSPAEMLLSENLAVFENFAQTQFGGEALRELRDSAIKLRATLTKELSQFPNKSKVDLEKLNPGEPILRGMWNQVAAKRQAFSGAADDVIKSAVKQYIDTAGKATTKTSIGEATVVGKAVRNMLEATRTNFRKVNQANYEEAGRVLKEAADALGDPLLAEQLVKFEGPQRVFDKFSDVAKITKVVPGEEITDPLTGIVTKTEPSIQREQVDKLVPQFFSKWKSAFKKMEQGVSLETANELRRAISDDISDLGGFGKNALSTRSGKFLQELRAAVGKSMEEAHAALPDGRAREALLKANEFYNTNVGKFQTPTIRKLFDSTPEGLARMADEDIVEKVVGNADAYRELKNFVGDDEIWSSFKRGALDDILANSSLEGSPKVGEIYIQLKKLPRDVRSDLLGGEEAAILKLLRQVSDLRLDEPKRRVDFESLQMWLEDPSSTTKDAVMRAASAQVALDQEFKSALKSRLIQKFQSPELLNDKDTVGRLLDLATKSEAKWAASQLGEGPLREKLAQQTVEEVFRRANLEGKLNALDMGMDVSPNKFLNTDSIRNQILGPKKDIYRELMGEETYQLMTDYLRFLTRGDRAKEIAGPKVGTLTRGEAINSLFQSAGNAYRYTKWKIVSTLLAAGPTRKWLLGRGFENLESENMLPAILASGTMAARFATFLGDETREGINEAFAAYNKAVETMAPNSFPMQPDLEEDPEATTPEQP